MNLKLTVEEVEKHLHPLSPKLSTSRLKRLAYDINAQQVVVITVTVSVQGGKERTFMFDGVAGYGDAGTLSVPEPLDSGILIIDVRDRGWEHPFVVIGDDDEFTFLFGASDLYELS